jgi:hypothetical protein
MISFFFGNSGAGEIRGRQVGSYLGAKLNPSDDFQEDVCIYVKMRPPDNFSKHSYVDVVDGVGLVDWLQKHPNCGAITTSLTGQVLLSKYLKQKVIFIPENHCNYERYIRVPREVKVAGIIGNMKGFGMSITETEKRLNDIGMEFKVCDSYRTRQDVIDFYKTIDIQLCWRPHVKGSHSQLHNPLKIANAASFGIPTVAYPEDNFLAEFGGCFFSAFNIEDFFRFVHELKTEPRLYDHLVKQGLERAERYHIENIAPLYEALS